MNLPGRAILLLLLLLARGAAGGDLRGDYARLAPQLAASPFGVPLHVESTETDGAVRGAVAALMPYPVPRLRTALQGPGAWCELLVLHPNVKDCAAGPGTLRLSMGRKTDGPGEGDHELNLDHRSEQRPAGEMAASLTAANGPVGTSDYRLTLEALDIGRGRSFVRLAYGVTYGPAARLATEAYLRTAGRDKVGFSRDGDGALVGGLRGALERNAMRYYLALETYLESLGQPAPRRRQWRFDAWYAATAPHARQLRDLTREEYLAAKSGRPL